MAEAAWDYGPQCGGTDSQEGIRQRRIESTEHADRELRKRAGAAAASLPMWFPAPVECIVPSMSQA
jgi:hypothetical protein